MLERLREEWRVLSGFYVRESERRIGVTLADCIRDGARAYFEDGRWVIRFRGIGDYRLPRYSKATNHRIAMAALEALR